MNRTVFLGMLLVTTPAFAQEPADTVRLEPVVATATRLTLPISKVTAAVTVIDGAELRRRGVRTVAEALRTVSGANVVQSGSYGANTSLFMRGGESDYVQLLVDGIQVNSPGEQFNWSSLALEDVDRIEIVKGPASVLYGSDAVTGVVQLFTRRGIGHPRGDVAVSLGRGDKVGAQADGGFNNGYARAEVSGGSSNINYSAGASHFGTEGLYAFNNEHRNTSLTARASMRTGSRSDLAASVRYSQNRYHFPTDGSGQLTDRNQFQDAATLAAGITLTQRFSPRLNARVELQHNHNDATTDDQPDDAADTVGFYRFHSDERFSRQQLQLGVDYVFGRSSTLTLGGELEQQSNRASSASPFGDAPEKTEKRSNNAIYAQWLADLPVLTVQLGARAEDNETFGGFATYRAGLSVRVTDALRLRAAGGTAFKEPRFFEQFAQGFVRGNPSLEPEQSRSIEAGADITWNRATFNATYFDQKFKDLIQYVAVTARPNDPNYINVAGARAAGLELTASIPVSRFLIGAHYTHLDTRVTGEGDGGDPSFVEGKSLLRRPRHAGSLSASAVFARGHINSSVHYVGERADVDFADFPATRVTLPSYMRVDVGGEFRVNKAIAGTLKLENAFDESYQEVLGFAAPRRVVHAGMRLTF